MQIKANTKGVEKATLSREPGEEGRGLEHHASHHVHEAANRIGEVEVASLGSCACPYAHPLLLSLAYT
jgi:hypothetical protein